MTEPENFYNNIILGTQTFVKKIVALQRETYRSGKPRNAVNRESMKLTNFILRLNSFGRQQKLSFNKNLPLSIKKVIRKEAVIVTDVSDV